MHRAHDTTHPLGWTACVKARRKPQCSGGFRLTMGLAPCRQVRRSHGSASLQPRCSLHCCNSDVLHPCATYDSTAAAHPPNARAALRARRSAAAIRRRSSTPARPPAKERQAAEPLTGLRGCAARIIIGEPLNGLLRPVRPCCVIADRSAGTTGCNGRLGF